MKKSWESEGLGSSNFISILRGSLLHHCVPAEAVGSDEGQFYKYLTLVFDVQKVKLANILAPSVQQNHNSGHFFSFLHLLLGFFCNEIHKFYVKL